MDSVIVSVIGMQRDVYEEEDVIEQEVVGRYYRKNDVSYITYQEDLSDTSTKTMLKIYADHVVLMRSGAVEQCQEFREGKKTTSKYNTPYGQLQMGVYTKRLDVTFGIGSGVVEIEYELEVDGQWQSNNYLAVSIREVQNSGN